jgi:hypothetical protein
VRFCFALAASRAGVVLYGLVAMSDHYHAVAWDPEGRISVFLEVLNRLLAKLLNASQGRWGVVWEPKPASLVVLGDDEDVLARLAYLAANPVAAGLVERPEAWPGVLELPREGRARSVRVRRPRGFFAADTKVPAELTLRVMAPRMADFGARLEAAIAGRVAEAAARVRREGRGFVGRAGVLEGAFGRRARSRERRRDVRPQVAARDLATRRRLRGELRAFRAAHREARLRWCGGDREAVFPAGTWWMRVHHGARVAAPPVPG